MDNNSFLHPRQPPATLRLVRALLIVILALALSEGLWQNGLLSGAERFYGDLWTRIAGQRYPVKHVVLVKVDEASLSAYPNEPLLFWGPRYAQATRTLREAGATVVGIDFLFSASPEEWFAHFNGVSSVAARNFDQGFRQELATGKVVLAGMQTMEETLLPAQSYLMSLPGFDTQRYIGAADLLPDSDGTLRSIYPNPPLQLKNDSIRLLSLPFLLALHASQQSPEAMDWQFGSRRIRAGQRLALAYAGPPGTVPALSIRDALAPDALNNPAIQDLKGKVVIIGPSYSGLNDAHLTPYGRGFFEAPLMIGAEIQAQTVEALLRGRFIDNLPTATRLGLAALLALSVSLFWWRQRLLTGLLPLAATILAASILGYMGTLNDLLMPTAHLQFSALFTFAGIYGWRFTHGEYERERLRTMFSRYLDPKIVDTLISSGELPHLGGESREMTVLFTDIRNFTTISEQLSPEEVVEMLNNYLGRACAVLAEEGACIDKFIGDAIMAVFGVPLKSEDHARRALRAAVNLREVADEFRNWMHERFADRNLPEFGIGIGIHTGPAVAGNIGTPQRMEYTAIGDSVNLASRIEGMTKVIGCVILASQDTLDSAGPGFMLGRSSTINVKGRAQPVDVREVLASEG